jgi:hypothetical protein
VPQLKLAQVPLAKLRAAAYNPRHMPDEELQALARSMAEFGVVDPVIANKDGTVIGGHQRLKPAQLGGIETLLREGARGAPKATAKPTANGPALQNIWRN